MPANIINSGSPLSGGATAPLWTDSCDNSSNLVNTPAPNQLVVPLGPVKGPGTYELQFPVSALDAIDQVLVTGTLKGKLLDALSINLKHETLGALALLTGHIIESPLSTPYPLPPEIRTFLFGQTIPTGYQFVSFSGPGSSQFLTVPEDINPNNYYYYNYYYAYYQGFSWQVFSVTPGAAPYQITVPAHRQPYTPDYNYDNAPGNIYVTAAAPLIVIFRNFRYRILSLGASEATIVSNQSFANIVYDNGTQNSNQGYYSTGQQPWNDFNNYYNTYYGNQSFSEGLYANYGAQDWLVYKVTRVVSNYVVSLGLSFYIATRVVDTYYVKFLKWPDILWEVEPLSQVTWQSIFAPQAQFQFYPPDYTDYLNYAQRSEALSLTSLDWKGKPADGIWTLEVIAATSSTNPLPASNNVTPCVVGIDTLQVAIQFKTNNQYLSSTLASTIPSAGIVQAYTQANLRANADDRALIAILCGINGSSTMGFLCGYSILRIGRTGEIYNVSYFVARTCNVNHANMTRNAAAISYWAQNWGDRPFSTKGDAAEAFVMGPTQHRIYPVRGQIGLQVQIKGSQLIFQMMGQYAPLVVTDPTVPLINKFTRLSLNA